MEEGNICNSGSISFFIFPFSFYLILCAARRQKEKPIFHATAPASSFVTSLCPKIGLLKQYFVNYFLVVAISDPIVSVEEIQVILKKRKLRRGHSTFLPFSPTSLQGKMTK